MERRELVDEPVEAIRSAMDGQQANMWTAMPGLIESFDPAAMTVAVQPAIKGRVRQEDGSAKSVNMPLLADVPVYFPRGGGFTLTHPIHPGDECLVVFGSRCIDGWWQSGGVQEPAEQRMHDLSDAFALIGPTSQPGVLVPPVDPENVQLRTDDGEAHITMMPDYTIRALNPLASVEMTPAGDIFAKADQTIKASNNAASVELTPDGNIYAKAALAIKAETPAASVELTPQGVITAQAAVEIKLAAPRISLCTANLSMAGLDGTGATSGRLVGNLDQVGWHKTSGDQVAGGVSQIAHVHDGVEPGGGTTAAPVGGAA